MKNQLYILLVFLGGGLLVAGLQFISGGSVRRQNVFESAVFDGRFKLKVTRIVEKHTGWYFVSYYKVAPEVPISGSAYILSPDSLLATNVSFKSEMNSARLSFTIPGYSENDIILVGKVVGGQQEWSRRDE